LTLIFNFFILLLFISSFIIFFYIIILFNVFQTFYIKFNIYIIIFSFLLWLCFFYRFNYMRLNRFQLCTPLSKSLPYWLILKIWISWSNTICSSNHIHLSLWNLSLFYGWFIPHLLYLILLNKLTGNTINLWLINWFLP
jgi:hypothetical protein